MDGQLRRRTPGLLVCSLLLVLAFGINVAWGGLTTRPATTTPRLTGDNVCSREVYRSGYEYRNVSVGCYAVEHVDGPCDEDEADQRGRTWYGRRHHHYRRHKRTEHSDWDDASSSSDSSPFSYHMPCYRVTRKTCWRPYRSCVRRRATEYYCCPGSELTPSGQCRGTSACSDNNGGCEQLCVHDDIRGHYCTCFPGYDLYEDIHCVDLDECKENNGGCDHTCHNTMGGSYCSCRPGYLLTGPTDCTPINECEIGNGGCEQLCTDTEDAFYCECDDGFKLVDGYKCEDIDECENHNGGCSHECVNRVGYYYCTCPEALSLDEAGETCVCPEGTILGEDGVTCLPEPIVSGPRTDAVKDPSGVPLALLIGAPVAGVIFIIILALLAFCCCRKCLRRRREPVALAAEDGGAIAAVAAVPAVIVVKAPIEKKDKKKGLDNVYTVEPGDKKVDSIDPKTDEEVAADLASFVPPTYLEAMGYDVPKSQMQTPQPDPYDTPGPSPDYETIAGADRPHSYKNLAYSQDEENVKKKLPDDKPQSDLGEEQPKVSVSDKIKQFQNMAEKK